MSSPDSSTLISAAHSVVTEIRAGRWRHVAELETKPPGACEEIIAELRSRCPGYERADYESALAGRLTGHPAPVDDAVVFLWLVGATFIWALPIGAIVAKRFAGGGGEWISVCAYPTMCGIAALYLISRKFSGRVVFAVLNIVASISWVIFVIWAARAFARSFWK